MSLSREQRLDNMEYALRLFMETLGDHCFYDTLFVKEDKEYEGVHATTWADLEAKYWIELSQASTFQNTRYRLKAIGWITGIDLTEIRNSPAFKSQMSRLAATLKSYMKDRKEGRLEFTYSVIGRWVCSQCD